MALLQGEDRGSVQAAGPRSWGAKAIGLLAPAQGNAAKLKPPGAPDAPAVPDPRPFSLRAAAKSLAPGKPHVPPEHTTWEAEAFIPVSRFEIAEELIKHGQWGDATPDQVRRLFRYLAAWRHVVYKERLDELDQTYMPFSSETDLLRIGDITDAQREDYRGRFLAGLKRLLKQANYIEISLDKVSELMNQGSLYKLDLKVELADFEECILFRRGTDFKTLKRRSPWTGYLVEKTIRYPIYQRLCVVLKLWPEDVRVAQVMKEQKVNRQQARKIVRKSRSSLPDGIEADKIYVKLFRDIPHAELEMLFPNTQVRLSRLDKIRIGGSAASGVGLGVFGLVTKLLAAAAFSPYALIVGLFGLGTVMFRQVMGFFNQRTQYMKVLAQNLYFHSLADNRSAFTLLANRAEEEDIKEEMLLYTILSNETIHRHEMQDVRTHLSAWLREKYEVDVDFDAEDALSRLVRDGVVKEAPDGLLTTLRPAEALSHYDEMWDGYLQPGGMDRRLLDEDRK